MQEQTQSNEISEQTSEQQQKENEKEKEKKYNRKKQDRKNKKKELDITQSVAVLEQFEIELYKSLKEKYLKFTYPPVKIMLQFSKERLKQLGDVWKLNSDGVNIQKFTQFMLDRINTKNDDETYELIYGCYKLFHEVDINGDGNMEWGEFMQYIIDAVTSNTITSDGNLEVAEQISKLKAKKFHRFALVRDKVDKSHHNAPIQKAIYCASSQLILAFEKFEKQISFYDLDFGVVKKEIVPMKKPGFITSVAYDEKNKLFGVTATDNFIYIYAKTKVRIELINMIESECIQEQIWFMQSQQLWLTAGKDYKVRHWNIKKQGGECLQTLKLHSKKITDMIEILTPLCVATCSRDKTIVLFDIEHREHLRTIKEHHDTPIRHLRYQHTNGPQMVSISSDIEANVWAPESLVSDIHVGKLVGHKKQIVDGQYLAKAPYFVTLDETNLVCFWDITNLQCIQSFICQTKIFAEGLVIISNKLFWCYGSRFNQFDTLGLANEDDKDIQDLGAGAEADQLYAQQVIINDYLMSLTVILKNEIRLYDILTGKLLMLHSNVFQEEDANSDIQKVRIDKRNRKLYISNNLGKIVVSNCQNGVIVKNATQHIEDKENIIKSEAAIKKTSDNENLQNLSPQKGVPILSKNKKLRKKESNGSLGSSKYSEQDVGEDLEDFDMEKLINQQGGWDSSSDDDQEPTVLLKKLRRKNIEFIDLHLLWEEEFIMMVASTANEFMVFDEEDPENSKLLRRVRRVHDKEITISAFDFHLGLVATGCINGEIAIFDFEMSKLEGLLIGHTQDITAMEFVAPFPILISASMDSTVCIWGIRPLPMKLQNVCLKRFQNVSWIADKDVKCIPTRLHVWENDNMKGIRKFRKLNGKMLLPTAYRGFEQNFVFTFREPEEMWEEEFSEMFKNEISSRRPKGDQKYQMVLKGKIYEEILNDKKSKLFVTQLPTNDQEYNENLDKEIPRRYLYIGDEQGYLKIWNLTGIFESMGINKVPRYFDIRNTWNPRRKGLVDNWSYAQSLRLALSKLKTVMPYALDPSLTGQLVREVQGHFDAITSIINIQYDDCSCIVTGSRDSQVRIWSLGFDLLGIIDLNTNKNDPKWHVPTNKKKKNIEQEIENIEIMMDKLNLPLEYNRKKIKVDQVRPPTPIKDKPKSRQNWFTIQENRRIADLDYQKNQDKIEREFELKKAKEELERNHLDRAIKDQEIFYHISKMNIPHEVKQGYSTNLNNELNKMQKQATTDLLKQLNKEKDMVASMKQEFGKQTKFNISGKDEKKYMRKKLSQKNLSGHASVKSSQKRSSYRLELENNSSEERSKQNLLKTQTNSVEERELTTFREEDTLYSNRQFASKNITQYELSSQANFLEVSKQDKDKIASLAMIPNLRKKFTSLDRKDRFASIAGQGKFNSDTIESLQSPNNFSQQQQFMINSVKGLAGNSINRAKDVSIRASVNYSQFINIQQQGRKFSIADSEIQKFEESSEHNRIREIQKQSIDLSLDFITHTEDDSKASYFKLPPLFNNGQNQGLLDAYSLSRNDSQDNSLSPRKYNRKTNNSYAMNNLSPTSIASLRGLQISFPENSQKFQKPSRIIKQNPLINKIQASDILYKHRQDMNRINIVDSAQLLQLSMSEQKNSNNNNMLSNSTLGNKKYLQLIIDDQSDEKQNPKVDQTQSTQHSLNQLANIFESKKVLTFLQSPSQYSILNETPAKSQKKQLVFFSQLQTPLLNLLPQSQEKRNSKYIRSQKELNIEENLDIKVRKNGSMGRSQKHSVTDRDIQKNHNFEILKHKYLGGKMKDEQKTLKDRLDEQKEMVRKLKQRAKYTSLA